MSFSPFVLLFLLSTLLHVNVVQSQSNSTCPTPSCYKSSSPLQGVCPPAFTPFKDNGEVNYDVIPKYVKYLCDSGIRCIFVSTDFTASFTLTLKDKIKLVREFVTAAKLCGIAVIPEVGGQSLGNRKEMAKKVASMGVPAVSMQPEIYYITNETSANADLLCQIGEYAQIPVIYYDIPVQTHVTQNVAKIWSLAAKKCPNSFGGMKTYLLNALDVIAGNTLTSQQSIFVTYFEYSASAYGYCLNGTTDVTFNIFPNASLQIESLVKSGNYQEAFNMQLKYNKFLGDLLAILNIDTNDVTAYRFVIDLFREAFHVFSGINIGPVPSPTIRQLTQQEKNRVNQVSTAFKRTLLT